MEETASQFEDRQARIVAWQALDKYPLAALAILFIDLDNFKTINDTLGHGAGDELLRQTAVRLKNAVRTSDHVVPLGGDKFMVILEQADAVEDVSRVAGHIVKLVSAHSAQMFGMEARHRPRTD